ncbi:GMC family oxidoreductase N-terminal domain-containing protein [Pirellulaceae bacterium SH449]
MPKSNQEKISRRDLLLRSAGVVAGSLTAAATGRAAPPTPGPNSPPSNRKSTDSDFKRTARADYGKSLQHYGGQLQANPRWLFQMPFDGKPYQFDVLVVGSGYGAAITAARLSEKMRSGTRIGVLERGREWVPGNFPDTLKDVMSESRLHLFGRKQRRLQNPTGLFQVLQCDDIAVLSGSGLGGSSLINANVAIRPDSDVFLQTQWPNALRDMGVIDPYYDITSHVLGVRVEPHDWTHKMRAQRLAVERLQNYGLHYEAAALTIVRSGPNHLPVMNQHGMLQRSCIDCGDCLTGCNVGAKNTLVTNYLPIARRNNTMMFTQTEVREVEKCDGFWRVRFLYFDRKEDGSHEEYEGFVTTRILVLGAGSIGSSEILMRSQSECLDFSRQLGCNWTGNGDALGFIRKTDCPTCVAGSSAYEHEGVRSGPTIQTNVTTPNYPNLFDRTLVQEGVAARAYTNVLKLLMRDLDLDQTQILLGMGHDRQEGKLILEDNGNASVSWPGLTKSDYRRMIREQFSRIAHAHGGQYKYLKLFGDKMISVHPLGGCGMSDDPRSGVVNHKGQVYDTACGGDIAPQTGEFRIHEGLYVCDGAILPTAIACNPFLTISALAERNSQLLALEPKYADIFKL